MPDLVNTPWDIFKAWYYATRLSLGHSSRQIETSLEGPFGTALWQVFCASRHLALLQAARDVCGYCGARFTPGDKGLHKVLGPNAGGNYYHGHGSGRALCAASAIHALIAFEKNTERGSAEPPV